jgi:hypothetical protein
LPSTTTCSLLIDHFDPCQLNTDVAGNAVWAFGCLVHAVSSTGGSGGGSLDQNTLRKAVLSLSRALTVAPTQARSYYDNVVIALGKTVGACRDFIDIGACLPRYTRLLSVCKNLEESRLSSAGMLSFLAVHATHYMSRWPAECVRIACVGRPANPANSAAFVAHIKEHVVGPGNWEAWRLAHLPDIDPTMLH